MRLLVVEDDVALGQILVRGLTEDGYAVDLEGTSAGAQHAIDHSDYDLVILDLGLPDGDGVTLCRRLRDRRLRVPVLMLTARDGLNDKVAGLDAGADDYLTKPFDYLELAARVRALLRRPPETTGPVLEVGDIRLDPAAHTVWRGAIVVPLTAREFSLLEYLMRRPGAVLTRSELLEHVWDANYDGLSNVVDVHIANLRRKLAVSGADVPIETIRGVGYQLTP
ncbi:MAG: response regulator transcription factor [Actinomycetota bacterium]